jgi:CRISPR-associated protein Cas2
MLVLITYDVRTDTGEGQRRLRRVAKVCENYGQRVQDSVFECLVDPEQWIKVKNRLTKEIKLDEDSLRFYFLGKNWQLRVEHVGLTVLSAYPKRTFFTSEVSELRVGVLSYFQGYTTAVAQLFLYLMMRSPPARGRGLKRAYIYET